MGIYLPNMEMPKSGTYEVSIDNTNGKDKTIMSMFVRGAGGLICCGVYELVSVPPHGRVIDADEFLKRAIGTKCFRGDYALMLEELVGESTTILEAEEGE